MKEISLLFIGFLTFVILGSATGCEGQDTQNLENVSAQIEESTDEVNEAVNELVGDSKVLNQKVKISTVHGDMIVLLYDDTPLHRDNFIKLVKEGFYEDLLFHRVMQNFMIQGGDPKSKGAAPNVRLGSGGPGYTIPAEMLDHHIHTKGKLAAARQPDQVNPERNSSGSQFYIVQGKPFPPQQVMSFEARRNVGKDSTEFFHYSEEMIKTYAEVGGYPSLDGGYTVFGEVIEGMEVIDKIAAMPTKPGNRPVEDIVMSLELID